MTIEELVGQIQPACAETMAAARKRWRYKCMPIGSMGAFQDMIVSIAGMQRMEIPEIRGKMAMVIAADNGVVEEGVSQSGSEVTAQVVANMVAGQSGVALLAEYNYCPLYIINMGMKTEEPMAGVDWHPLMYGTANMTKGPAMDRETVEKAILYGAERVMSMADCQMDLFSVGEMGIGNTTTSSAVLSVLTETPPREVTGRGAGLSAEGMERKISAIQRAIDVNQPDKADVLDVLSKVGGLDIAGMVGCYLGIAASKRTAVIDGFISSVAALAAVRLCPACKDYMIASHRSLEPGAALALSELGLDPVLESGMHLGEGSGAVMFFSLLEQALYIYKKLPSFDEGHVETYEEFD